VEDDEHRVGDSATLVADAAKAKFELGWQFKYDELETIVSHT